MVRYRGTIVVAALDFFRGHGVSQAKRALAWTSVVPDAWIRDTLTPDEDTVEAFTGSLDAREFPEGAYYRNQFWVIDPHAPIYLCSGINGQTVLIHGPADVVIAKFSTWPVAWSPEFAVPTWKGLVEVAEQVAAG